MSLPTQPYKGTRDFYPDDMRTRKWMFEKWRTVCEGFGYEEYDAPVLEPLELYTAKTSEEIVNEQTYSFEDRGGRKVVMRPEMTPSVSRMVAARRQELAYPLRLYSIPNCFRYERMQRGRLREFWQLNADLFGVEGIEADMEMIQVADAIMKAFGATESMYEIRINSRKLLDKAITQADPKQSKDTVMQLVDKKDKMSADDFSAKLRDVVSKPKQLENWLNSENPGENDGEITELLARLRQAGIANVRFVPAVARGFDYYTDIVFEVFDNDPENNRAMFGGGRYDGLVGQFGVEPVPTVGFAMGDVTLLNFLSSHQLLPELPSDTDIYVVLVGDVYDRAQDAIMALRSQGLRVAVDSTNRKPDKQLKAAVKKGVRYALFVGEKELEESSFTLRDLQAGSERVLTAGEVAQAVLLARTSS